MKKLLLSTAIACMAGQAANAQELILEQSFYRDGWNGTYVVSPKLTTSQKSILMTSTQDEDGHAQATLYNTDLSVAKTLHINVPSYKYEEYTEVATVEPNGSSVATEENDWGTYFEDVDVTAITSSAALIEAVKSSSYYYGTEDLVPYTDTKGRIGFITPGASYYNSETYGTKYPESYYAIKDGTIRQFYCSYYIQYEYPIPYTLNSYGERVYSSEGLTWKREYNDDDEDEIRYGNMGSLSYTDYDKSEGVEVPANLTQTLFNSDSKWEYLVPIQEEYSKYSTPSETDYYYDENGRHQYYEDNNLHLRRRYTRSAHTVGYNVVSEGGTTVMTLKSRHATSTYFRVEKILIWGGKKYILTYDNYTDEEGEYYWEETLYLYDTYTTTVKEVNSVKSRQPMATVSGESIDVILSEGDTDSDLILSNMAGQVVGKKHVSAGETKARMRAAGMPKGIYNLTLRRQGQVLNNQKLMVK
jgi:hypothetical protein